MPACLWRVKRSFGPAMLAGTLAAAFAVVHPGPASAATALENSSLETDADGNGVPDCWAKGGYGLNTYAFERVADAHDGTWGERVTVSFLSSGDRKLVTKLDSGACAQEVTPGRSYVLGAWYKSTVPTYFVSFTRNESTGAWSYWRSGPQVPASSTWRYVTWTTPAIPSGVGHTSFGVNLNRVGSLTVDDFSLAPASPTSSDEGTGGTTSPPSTGGSAPPPPPRGGAPPPPPPGGPRAR